MWWRLAIGRRILHWHFILLCDTSHSIRFDCLIFTCGLSEMNFMAFVLSPFAPFSLPLILEISRCNDRSNQLHWNYFSFSFIFLSFRMVFFFLIFLLIITEFNDEIYVFKRGQAGENWSGSGKHLENDARKRNEITVSAPFDWWMFPIFNWIEMSACFWIFDFGWCTIKFTFEWQNKVSGTKGLWIIRWWFLKTFFLDEWLIAEQEKGIQTTI